VRWSSASRQGRREDPRVLPPGEQAEAFIAEVEQDEPETAALLTVVALEFEQVPI
jgi:hypothetical protein